MYEQEQSYDKKIIQGTMFEPSNAHISIMIVWSNLTITPMSRLVEKL